VFKSKKYLFVFAQVNWIQRSPCRLAYFAGIGIGLRAMMLAIQASSLLAVAYLVMCSLYAGGVFE